MIPRITPPPGLHAGGIVIEELLDFFEVLFPARGEPILADRSRPTRIIFHWPGSSSIRSHGRFPPAILCHSICCQTPGTIPAKSPRPPLRKLPGILPCGKWVTGCWGGRAEIARAHLC